jgi:hypothetical protein
MLLLFFNVADIKISFLLSTQKYLQHAKGRRQSPTLSVIHRTFARRFCGWRRSGIKLILVIGGNKQSHVNTEIASFRAMTDNKIRVIKKSI